MMFLKFKINRELCQRKAYKSTQSQKHKRTNFPLIHCLNKFSKDEKEFNSEIMN